ncbi:MAG: hypothetical protein RQ735_05470 [Flavobacteriaceae bacterium]|nr:hypothetical protein [Flavobacteriaceae bacterium]
MKTPSPFYIKTLFSVLLALLFIGQTQAQKKERLRLSVNHFSVIDQEDYLNILARYKGENGYESVSGISLEIFQVLAEDSLVSLGNINTNKDGIAKFIIKNKRAHVADTVFDFTYLVQFEGDDKFRSADSDMSVSALGLTASIEIIDSIPHIQAKMIDPKTGDALTEEPLRVRLKRLFKPLIIGEDTYFTDEEGQISVAVPEGLQGEDGQLDFEVVLDEHDTYGTVISHVTADFGIAPTDESTFNSRELWSPAGKTPVFMLIFPNLLIFGIWFVILLSFRNLLLIFKSKNNENN